MTEVTVGEMEGTVVLSVLSTSLGRSGFYCLEQWMQGTLFSEDAPRKYGARVLAKISDDKSCNDPKDQQDCQEAMKQDCVIIEYPCDGQE